MPIALLSSNTRKTLKTAFLVPLALLLVFSPTRAQAPTDLYQPAVRIGTVNAQFIDEASGIASSRRNPGIIWLNNDSGDGAYLYAVDRRGKTRGVFLVRSASASDWEDIAYGPGPDGKGNFIYIGDIGDNERKRGDCAVYRVPEPKIGTTPGTKVNPLLTEEPASRRTFRYPDGPHNAECLLVHPKTGIVYIVTKEENGQSSVFRFPAEPKNWWEVNTLEKVATLQVPKEVHPYPNLITGGCISPDGKKVTLCTYAAVYELHLPGSASSFEGIWKAPLLPVRAPVMIQREAICYEPDGKALLTTSEKVPTPLYELKAAK